MTKMIIVRISRVLSFSDDVGVGGGSGLNSTLQQAEQEMPKRKWLDKTIPAHIVVAKFPFNLPLISLSR